MPTTFPFSVVCLSKILYVLFFPSELSVNLVVTYVKETEDNTVVIKQSKRRS